MAVLANEGFAEVKRIGRPYDLQAFRDDLELHIEVKGSSCRVDAVILTRNEVSHAAENLTSLFVIDEIEVTLTEAGYACRGGRLRRWDSWMPGADSLTPLQYSYALPE